MSKLIERINKIASAATDIITPTNGEVADMYRDYAEGNNSDQVQYDEMWTNLSVTHLSLHYAVVGTGSLSVTGLEGDLSLTTSAVSGATASCATHHEVISSAMEGIFESRIKLKQTGHTKLQAGLYAEANKLVQLVYDSSDSVVSSTNWVLQIGIGSATKYYDTGIAASTDPITFKIALSSGGDVYLWINGTRIVHDITDSVDTSRMKVRYHLTGNTGSATAKTASVLWYRVIKNKE